MRLTDFLKKEHVKVFLQGKSITVSLMKTVTLVKCLNMLQHKHH
jgi:hypothetical protein